MKAFYSDVFVLPLPPEHRFPMAKYRLLRERVIMEGLIKPVDLRIPPAATDEQILRCHDATYLEKVKTGNLTRQEIRRIGFPWSPGMVERSRRSTGATIAACYAALNDGIAANLAGGTHHACTDHGEGYCVFNDAAVAARELQAHGLVQRVVVIDCDVHQGNGTAQVTTGDPTIFTLSIHGERNFPFRKHPGDLDIGLPDGMTDDDYLYFVEEGVQRALFASGADMAIYVSGADPYTGDRLGKLSISKNGLQTRDKLVLSLLREANLPVAVVMGGGYAHNIEDIVEIHMQTLRTAATFAWK